MSAPAILLAVPLLGGVVAGVACRSGPFETLIALAIGWTAAALTFRTRPTRAFVLAVAAAAFAAGAAIGGAAQRASAAPPPTTSAALPRSCAR